MVETTRFYQVTAWHRVVTLPGASVCRAPMGSVSTT